MPVDVCDVQIKQTLGHWTVYVNAVKEVCKSYK